MKTAIPVIGLLLIVGTLAGGNIQYLTDWSNPELVGYNIWSLFALLGGGYMVYWGIKKSRA
jgi:hypothetical protein